MAALVRALLTSLLCNQVELLSLGDLLVPVTQEFAESRILVTQSREHWIMWMLPVVEPKRSITYPRMIRVAHTKLHHSLLDTDPIRVGEVQRNGASTFKNTICIFGLSIRLRMHPYGLV
jgi:hypothetical protein